ncbi:DUF3800 domain-containing protein [Halobacteriota archaeon]
MGFLTSPILYIFVDESGDLGFSERSSCYFILTALVTVDPTRVGRIVKKVRKKVLKKKLSDIPELKFSRSTDKVKTKILEYLSKQDAEIWYVCLRKEMVYSHLRTKQNIIYNYLTGFIVEKIPTMRSKSVKVKIIVDKSLSKVNRQHFNMYLKEKYNFVSSNRGETPISIDIEHKDSQAERCLQVVDFISGAIFHKYEFNHPKYYDLIKSKIKEEVIKWRS